MAMMRRGPLDRYPPEWVLRQAHAHGISGSIEFNTEAPVTLYLLEGRVYAGVEGTGMEAVTAADTAAAAAEHEVRAEVISLLTPLLSRSDGWYYHDPLGHHPARGAWQWETAALLMETRVRAHEDASLATWTKRVIALSPVTSAPVTLGVDAWRVVASLAGSATGSELAEELGWPPARLVSALGEIERLGLLETDRRALAR